MSFVALVAIAAGATGPAWAQSYTITLPSVSNGSLTAKVNDASVTSAAAGATVSLVATPDAGYRLKTISGTYQGAPEETFQKGAATSEGSYFRLVASATNNAGWRLNTNSTSTITITSKNAGTLIDKVELNITPGNSFDFNLITVSSGTKARNGNVITITGINNTTLTITGTGNAAKGCTGTSAKITGATGTLDLSLTSTGDDNVKTFTMPSSNVTVSAEFEEILLYTVTFADGTEDVGNWSFNPGEAATDGVAEGTVVNISYGGTRKVKSVEATYVPAALPAATVATAPTATANVTAGSTTALVTAGTAEGGTMMYLVTTTNTQPATTEGFSATVPTAESLNAAGTYYVWYFAAGDAEHSDSEISASAVAVTVATITVTWNSTALSTMHMSFVSGSQSRTQDDVTVTMTASGEPIDFGDIMSVNGTGNFVFSTELGNITQIVISFSDMGSWMEANAGWPSWFNSYEAGTFTWSGTPASSVTLSGDGGSVIFGITSIVFTIQPNN